MIDTKGLVFLLIDALVLAVIVLKPMTRNYDDSDRGSGSVVVMKPPLRPSYKRCAVFLVVGFVVSAVLIGLRSPNLTDAYHNVVTQLMLSVVHNPSAVDGYAKSLLAVFQVSVLAFGVGSAVAFRASLPRRVVILLNVILFLVISAVVDAFFGIFVVVTGFPLGPTPVVSLLIQYLIAGIVLFPRRLHLVSTPEEDPAPPAARFQLAR